jgi:DNA-binding transcriptional regulator YdaS (Cro superfamily)
VSNLEALNEAIEVIGGVSALASAITSNDLPVKPTTVSMWRARGRMPPEYAPPIERETRRRGRPVTCERLAPAVAWAVLREQVAPDA